jgi:hypothetical protein
MIVEKQNLAYYSPEYKGAHRKVGFFIESGESSFAYSELLFNQILLS